MSKSILIAWIEGSFIVLASSIESKQLLVLEKYSIRKTY
jgi:hypothetical protein